MTKQDLTLKLADIKVPEDRIRKKFVHIDELAADIAKRGQLVAISVKPDGTLVDGQRRLEAMKKLGLSEARITYVEPKDGDDEGAEIAANVQRDGFKLEEMVNVALKKLENAPERRGRPSQVVQNHSDKNGASCPTFPERTKDLIAQELGFGSRETLERAISIIKAVRSGKAIPDIIEAVDRLVISIHRAVEICKQPKNKQITALNDSFNDPKALSDSEENKKQAKARRKAKQAKRWDIRDQCKGTPERNFGVLYLDINWIELVGPAIDALTDPVHCLLTPSMQAIFCKTDVKGIPNLMQAAEQWHWIYETFWTLEPPTPPQARHTWVTNDGHDLLLLFSIAKLPPLENAQRFLLTNSNHYAILDAISKFCPRLAKLDFHGEKRYKEWRTPTDCK